jgi:hypothetical protein
MRVEWPYIPEKLILVIHSSKANLLHWRAYQEIRRLVFIPTCSQNSIILSFSHHRQEVGMVVEGVCVCSACVYTYLSVWVHLCIDECVCVCACVCVCLSVCQSVCLSVSPEVDTLGIENDESQEADDGQKETLRRPPWHCTISNTFVRYRDDGLDLLAKIMNASFTLRNYWHRLF